jgi:aminoglycoside phosphotransferase (APT) family kinase protein
MRTSSSAPKARDLQAMTSLRFPSNLDGLTPEVMTALLAEQRPGAMVSKVNVLTSANRGDGVASTADRVALELEYEADVGLPSRMLLKTVLLHRVLRFGPSAIQLTGRVFNLLGSLPFGSRLRPWLFSAIGTYQQRYPHAPDAMYINEVRFYREIRSELSIEAPRCFGSVFDEEHRSFAVLMEDLSLRGARFPNALTSVTVEEIRGLVATLAALHARYWESPALQSRLQWLATPVSGGMYPVFQALGLDLIRNQVETNEYKAALIAPLGKTVDELWGAVWKAQEMLASGPQTLLHGDPHIANTYLMPNARGGFLDWQLMVKGRWAHDFTYILITGLSTELRRKHERDLLAFYLDELQRHGVQSPPEQNEAWLRYRQAAIWGLVIGWLITPTENYGEAITAANISRLVAAVQDLETLEALA